MGTQVMSSLERYIVLSLEGVRVRVRVRVSALDKVSGSGAPNTTSRAEVLGVPTARTLPHVLLCCLVTY